MVDLRRNLRPLVPRLLLGSSKTVSVTSPKSRVESSTAVLIAACCYTSSFLADFLTGVKPIYFMLW